MENTAVQSDLSIVRQCVGRSSIARIYTGRGGTVKLVTPTARSSRLARASCSVILGEGGTVTARNRGITTFNPDKSVAEHRLGAMYPVVENPNSLILPPDLKSGGWKTGSYQGFRAAVCIFGWHG